MAANKNNSDISAKIEMVMQLYKLTNDKLDKANDNLSSLGSLMAIISEKLIVITENISTLLYDREKQQEAFGKINELFHETLNALKILAKDVAEHRVDTVQFDNKIEKIEDKIESTQENTKKITEALDNLLQALDILESLKEYLFTMRMVDKNKKYQAMNNTNNYDRYSWIDKIKDLPKWLKFSIFISTLLTSGLVFIQLLKSLIPGL